MEEITLQLFSNYLKPRARSANKGDFGHVLVLGGEVGYSGAVILAAKAALRVGAGLASAAMHFSNKMTQPEIMCHPIDHVEQLNVLISKATVLVLGPGLGQTAWSQMIFDRVMEVEKPLIVDADGLNLLAKAPRKKENWILTPHPGEAARLLKKTTEEIQQDRVLAVKMLQQTYGGWVVLKGAGTLVVGPEQMPVICKAGNPGMATAGMGDVLSGVLGGLVGQGVPLGVAAKLAVVIHAMAGDLAAKEGERGMIASDLMPYLRKVVNSIL